MKRFILCERKLVRIPNQYLYGALQYSLSTFRQRYLDTTQNYQLGMKVHGRGEQRRCSRFHGTIHSTHRRRRW